MFNTTQHNYLKYINEAQNIIKPFNIPDSGLGNLAQQIQHAELIVPVVGGFSAGKSTLINSFLGAEILPTAITPETALATELRYSESEYIEAVTNADTVEKYALTDFPSLKDNARNFKLLRVYLNNSNLQAIAPLVLVDMPGFDAPIENHNQAILNYLNCGVYFIFLTSVEDGTITLSMKREIENLQRIGKGFSFCISKTNLRPESNIDAVKTQIKDQLNDLFDYRDDIILLDQNGGENLKKILTAIKPEALFQALFQDDLRNNYNDLLQSLNVKLSTFKNSQQEAVETMSALQQGIAEIIAKKDAAIRDLENRHSGKGVSYIIHNIVADLNKNKPRLIDLALQNPDSFSREINEIVKNSLLVNVQNSLENVANDMIQDFSISLNNLNDSTILGSDFTDKLKLAITSLLDSARGGLTTLAGTISERTKNAGSIYRVVATIFGLTTSVINPLLEVVIVFLPDIINYFTKEFHERRMREKVEHQINNIIPEISQKISQTLPEIFNARIRDLIAEISGKFEAELAQKRAEIEKAAAEKQQSAAMIEQEIVSLNQAKSKLTSLATEYLFSR